MKPKLDLMVFTILLASLIAGGCEKSDSLIGETHTIKIKNSDSDGKDAIIWTERPDRNLGTSSDFQAMAWTWFALGFDEGVRRSLIEFDLSDIPENANISQATLTLYYNPTSSDVPQTLGHSERSGSNVTILTRIVEPWEELEVTWNNQPKINSKDQIIVPPSFSNTQDYEIDVTTMIAEMIKNPDENYGFMFSLGQEDHYRAVILASSDHEDPALHPKLEIHYKTD